MDRKQSGVASGVLNTTHKTGSVIGVALFGSLIASNDQFISGMHMVLYSSIGVLCIGAIATLIMVRDDDSVILTTLVAEGAADKSFRCLRATSTCGDPVRQILYPACLGNRSRSAGHARPHGAYEFEVCGIHGCLIKEGCTTQNLARPPATPARNVVVAKRHCAADHDIAKLRYRHESFSEHRGHRGQRATAKLISLITSMCG